MKPVLPLSCLFSFFLLYCPPIWSQIELVKDINSTQDFGSYARKFFVFDSTLFFSASDGQQGATLWRSDGTTNGTSAVKEVAIADNGTFYQPFAATDNSLYFAGYDKGSGFELWKSDGTEAGTVVVADLNPGPESSGPGELSPIGNDLYFTTKFGPNDGALWRTDGVQTSWLMDVGTSPIPRLTVLQNKLVFAAKNSLWITDGTIVGIEEIVSPMEIKSQFESIEHDGVLYFQARQFSHLGFELWRTDGTLAGSYQLKDIWPGPGSSYPSKFVLFDDMVYFIASDSLHGYELWRTDGTEAGTHLVRDMVPGVLPSSISQIAYEDIFVYKNKLNIIIQNGSQSEWWQSKGDSASTEFVTYLPLAADRLAVSKDYLFFRGPTPLGFGSTIWRSDGTAAGTFGIDYAPTISGEGPEDLIIFNNKLAFSGYSIAHGREPWISDGSIAGTTELRNINTYSKGSMPYLFTAAPGRFYFIANDQIHGYELWQSDGTAAGTLVKDLTPGPYSTSGLRHLGAVDNSFYFFAINSSFGLSRLWRTQGADTAVVLIDSLNYIIDPKKFMAVNNQAVFALRYGNGDRLLAANGQPKNLTEITTGLGLVDNFTSRQGFGLFWAYGNKELWRTDATAAGTFPIYSFSMNTSSSVGDGFIAPLGTDKIVFASSDSVAGRELWVSDGTAAGTQRVMDITAGPASSYLIDFASIGPLVFFIVYDQNILTLWRTDGTADGTFALLDFSKRIYKVTLVDGAIFFFVQIEFGQFELWKSDGTVAGTAKVTEVEFPYFPGDGYDPPGPIMGESKGVGSTLFFMPLSADGVELWQSDGTAAGTFQLQDLRPGPASALIHDMTALDGRLYFAAEDGMPNGGNLTPNSEVWRTSATYVGLDTPKESTTFSLQLSPNPCTDVVQLGGLPAGAYALQLMDVNGKTCQIWQKEVQASVQLEILKNLPPGVYFLRAMDLKGRRVGLGRLVKM